MELNENVNDSKLINLSVSKLFKINLTDEQCKMLLKNYNNLLKINKEKLVICKTEILKLSKQKKINKNIKLSLKKLQQTKNKLYICKLFINNKKQIVHNKIIKINRKDSLNTDAKRNNYLFIIGNSSNKHMHNKIKYKKRLCTLHKENNIKKEVIIKLKNN